MFTKYKQYIEQKIGCRPKIEISIDDYKQKLISQVSGLVLKSSASNSCLKESLNCSELKYKLENLNYPYIESFILSLQGGNLQNMHEQMNKVERWLYYNCDDDSVFKMIESYVCSYQSNINRKSLFPEDVDQIVESLSTKTKDVLSEMASNIERIALQIGWNNHPIFISSIYDGDRVSNVANVFIGENYHMCFDYKKIDTGFVVENVVFSEMPSAMRSQIDALLQRIKESPKIKKMVTLYMSKPQSERNLFERKKREIALGMKTTLPKNTVLMNMPIDENNDIWKVRMREEKLSRILQEGDFEQYQIMDEVDLIWISKVKNNEK